MKFTFRSVYRGVLITFFLGVLFSWVPGVEADTVIRSLSVDRYLKYQSGSNGLTYHNYVISLSGEEVASPSTEWFTYRLVPSPGRGVVFTPQELGEADDSRNFQFTLSESNLGEIPDGDFPARIEVYRHRAGSSGEETELAQSLDILIPPYGKQWSLGAQDFTDGGRYVDAFRIERAPSGDGSYTFFFAGDITRAGTTQEGIGVRISPGPSTPVRFTPVESEEFPFQKRPFTFSVPESQISGSPPVLESTPVRVQVIHYRSGRKDSVVQEFSARLPERNAIWPQGSPSIATSQSSENSEGAIGGVEVRNTEVDGRETYLISGNVLKGSGTAELKLSLHPDPDGTPFPPKELGRVLYEQGKHFSFSVPKDQLFSSVAQPPTMAIPALLKVSREFLSGNPSSGNSSVSETVLQTVSIMLPSIDGVWSQGGQSRERVDFPPLEESHYAFYEDRGTGKVIWGLTFRGSRFSRERGETVYLILERQSDGTKKALCKFEGGARQLSGPSFPGCFLGNPSLLFKQEGVTYGKVDILDPQVSEEYSLFFSSKVDGSDTVSAKRLLPKLRFPLVSVVSIEEEKITGKDRKKRYQLKGTVEEDGQGVLIFSLYKNGSSVSVPYGSVPFKKGTSFQLPTPKASSQFTGLQPGSYLLKVKQLSDPNGDVRSAILKQVIPLKNPIPDESGVSHEGGVSGGDLGVSYTASQQDVLNNGIVPTDCGYNLGKGGRMCTLNDFMRLIKRVIDYIFILMIPIGAIVAAYAGYLILTSGGDTGKVKRAKDAGLSLLKGIGLFMLAWLIIKAIIDALGVSSNFNIFFGS